MNSFSIIPGGKRARLNKINLDHKIILSSIPVPPPAIYEMGNKKKEHSKVISNDTKNVAQEIPKNDLDRFIHTTNKDVTIPITINDELVKLTFIIPTIGRNSLKDTLNSLQCQSCENWNAFVIFDGIEPNIKCDDPRITFLVCNKLGEGPNYAAGVRNYGMTLETKEWIAFLDDDDSISYDYVDTFYKEIQTHNIDVIIFRMLFNKDILPELETDDFYRGKVGISFAIKKNVVNSGNLFSSSKYEDYEYLYSLKSKKYTIMISPYVLYFVREYNVSCSRLGNRVILNENVFVFDASFNNKITEPNKHNYHTIDSLILPPPEKKIQPVSSDSSMNLIITPLCISNAHGNVETPLINCPKLDDLNMQWCKDPVFSNFDDLILEYQSELYCFCKKYKRIKL